MEKKEEKNSKKRKIIVVIVIILALILAFLLWWFNRRFDVTFKYNNGLEDYKIQVKYLKYIDAKDVKKDLTADEKNFVGYYEVYYLDGTQIENIKKDTELEKTVCKEGFKLDSQKVKCVSETEFDFKNTKIKKATIIEALWSGIAFTINPTEKTINEKGTFTITATVTGAKDKTVNWSSENKGIATVDSNGKVTGVKAGTVKIYAESNGIRRTCTVTVKAVAAIEVDNGTISLSSSKSCIIGSNTVTITANVKNAKDSTVNWSGDSCLTINGSGNSVTVSANGCGGTITGKLNNGASNSVTLAYENGLVVTLTDYQGSAPYVSEGYYYGVKSIKTNIPAVITGSVLDKSDSPRTSASTSAGADGTVNIKTPCGQTKTYQLKAVIN